MNKPNIPNKPNVSKRGKSYKAVDKETIKSLKLEIKKLKAEIVAKNKYITEYEDNWDSISDEFYRNRWLVNEYQKRYGKINFNGD